MKKRISALLLSVVLCLGMLSTTAFAAEVSGTVNGETTALTVSGVTGRKLCALWGNAEHTRLLLLFYTESNGSADITVPTLAEGGKYYIDVEGADESELVYTFPGVQQPGQQYTITFNANGGSITGDVSTQLTNNEGKLTSLPEAARSNYSFDGWYTAASGGTKITTDTVFDKDTTVYAQWTYKSYGGGGSSRPGTSKPSTTKPSTPEPGTGDSNNPSTPVFNDVPETFWAKAEIAWASENGIMKGMSGDRFAPNNTVSRQQLWMVLGRLAGASPADMAAACAWAKENGISDGTRPGENVSRQQLVAMLYRYAKEQGYDTSARADISTYPDNGTVANYAKEALAWAIANGIVNGTSDGRLNPEGTATRAQFAVIMYRFDQKFGN